MKYFKMLPKCRNFPQIQSNCLGMIDHFNVFKVLTECKQGQMFASLLSRLEKKPACKGRSLETFLTYPMHQVSPNLNCIIQWVSKDGLSQ